MSLEKCQECNVQQVILQNNQEDEMINYDTGWDGKNLSPDEIQTHDLPDTDRQAL